MDLAGATLVDEGEGRGNASTGDWPAVLAMVVLYLVLTAWLSVELNVWRDEMYSLSTTAGSVDHAARHAIEFELQPPVYFVALAAWRHANDSIVFARLLSSLFGAGAIVVAVQIARRLLPGVRPAYVAALLATHPLLVWAGTEIRVYALVVFLSALLTWAFLRAYWFLDGTARARVAFVAIALVALYTQYYLIVLLFSFGVALLARRDRSRFWAYVLDAGAVGIMSVPLLLAIRAQLGSHWEDLGRRPPVGAEPLRVVATRFEAYFFSFNDAIDQAGWSLGAIRAARWAYRAVVLAAIGAGVWRLRRSMQDEATRGRVASVWHAGGGSVAAGIGAYAVCMVALVVAVGPMSVGERHTVGLLVPGILAAIAAPAAFLGHAATQRWAALLVASNVAATTMIQVVPRAKDCDCRRVAETIERRETPREPVVIFPSEDVMPLSVYYRGKNRLVPVPSAPSSEQWDQRTFVIEDPDDVRRALEPSAPEIVGLWVHTNTYGPTWGPEKLERFLAGGYREDAKYAFERGVVLRHFVPKAKIDASVETTAASP